MTNTVNDMMKTRNALRTRLNRLPINGRNKDVRSDLQARIADLTKKISLASR